MSLALFRIMYHFVCIPKYRQKVFEEPCRGALKHVIQKIGHDYDIEVVQLEIPIDHIHMVIKAELKDSPSEIMQKNKELIS